MPGYSSRVVYSSLFFLLTAALLVVARPRFMFDDEGNPKPFGVGPGRTLFSLGTALLVLAILSFYVFSLVEMVSAASARTRQDRERAYAHMVQHATTNVMPSSVPYCSPLAAATNPIPPPMVSMQPLLQPMQQPPAPPPFFSAMTPAPAVAQQ